MELLLTLLSDRDPSIVWCMKADLFIVFFFSIIDHVVRKIDPKRPVRGITLPMPQQLNGQQQYGFHVSMPSKHINRSRVPSP